MKKKKPTILIDFDDVIASCSAYAVECANRDYKIEPPITLDEITGWGRSGKRTDVIFKYFNEPDFFETQPLLPGAKDFISKISEKMEVFFVTAIPPQFMGIRAKRIIEEFPEVSPENIILGGRKDIMHADFMLDDGAHNIMKSSVTYPILLRRPWNQHITGVLAANTYDGVLSIINSIIDDIEPEVNYQTGVIALVGPSGSGKTAIIERLVNLFDDIEQPISTTTRNIRPNETINSYHFVSRDNFNQSMNNNEFIETTSYAGNMYGMKKNDIEKIISSGKFAVVALDICGAMAMKSIYPTKIFYIKRDKIKLIDSILNREISNDDKRNRIISLASEEKNETVCDVVIDNNASLDYSLGQIMSELESF